jgi:hypothetical protein
MACRSLFVIGLGAVLAACQPPPPRQQLDAEQVQQQATKLAGLCAQGALLADLVQQRGVTQAFPYVEQQAVAASAQKAISNLSRPAGGEVIDAQQALLQLAIDLQATVTRIAEAQDERAALQATGDKLRAMGARAQQLGRPAA